MPTHAHSQALIQRAGIKKMEDILFVQVVHIIKIWDQHNRDTDQLCSWSSPSSLLVEEEGWRGGGCCWEEEEEEGG